MRIKTQNHDLQEEKEAAEEEEERIEENATVPGDEIDMNNNSFDDSVSLYQVKFNHGFYFTFTIKCKRCLKNLFL